jgi:CRISPR-associated endoribonuclease Cas6/Csy4 subtype I-F
MLRLRGKMMQRYYFDFYIKNKTDAQKYGNSILSGIHHNLRNRNLDNIGLSFPEYGAEMKDGLPLVGNVIRLVSNSELDLFAMRGSEWFTSHILNGDFAVSKILPVPDSAREVFFVRSRTPESETKRMRSLFPGQRITPYGVNKASNQPLAMIKVYTIEKPLHMFVKLEPAEARKIGTFNSYGLCTQGKPVSVPWF